MQTQPPTGHKESTRADNNHLNQRDEYIQKAMIIRMSGKRERERAKENAGSIEKRPHKTRT